MRLEEKKDRSEDDLFRLLCVLASSYVWFTSSPHIIFGGALAYNITPPLVWKILLTPSFNMWVSIMFPPLCIPVYLASPLWFLIFDVCVGHHCVNR